MLGLAPVVAKLAPLVKAYKPTEFVYQIDSKYVGPVLADEIFKPTPIFFGMDHGYGDRTVVALYTVKDGKCFVLDEQILWKSGRGVQGASPEN